MNCTLGYSCSQHESSCFNAVRYYSVFRSSQLVHTLNPYGVGSCTFYLCPHLVEEVGQVNDFRFLRSIFKVCGTLCQNCCHHDVFCGSHAGEVKIDGIPDESLTACGSFNVIVLICDYSTQCFQPLKMQIYGSCAYGASARMRYAGDTLSGKQRSHYQYRGPHLVYQFKLGLCGYDVLRGNRKYVVFQFHNF